MSDIKKAYAASVDLTVTNLASIASSSGLTAGWTSATIDNSTGLYTDIYLSAQVKVAAASLSAGQIRMYVYGQLNDSGYADLFSAGTEGTEGTATIHDTEIRECGMKLAGAATTDTTNDRVYPLGFVSVAALFDGELPRKFAVFITHSTGQNFAASGHTVSWKGSYLTV